MILVELTPGPNMGYLAIVGSRWGRGAGLATIVGVTTEAQVAPILAAADMVLPDDLMKAIFKVSREIMYPMG